MKPIKMVGISIIAFLFIFGSLFTWQVWAQDDTNIEHEPSYKVVIQFTHDAEKTLEPYLPGISFAHLIEARTAKISVQELQKIHDRMVEKINVLEMAADSTVQADSAINIIQNRIDIFVTDPEAVDWPAVLGDDNKYAAVVKIDALPVPAADIKAGYFFDDNSCTIGWNVTYAGGRYASTAYHCPNILYQGNTLSTRVGWYGSTSDLELFYAPSGYSLPNRWQQGWGSNVVTIERSKSQTAVGQILCHIGAATDWRCGDVYSTNYNYAGSNTWVGVHFLTCGGDSGGPVLIDVQAYGMIVAGNCSTIGIYMSLDEFWSRSVHVATTP